MTIVNATSGIASGKSVNMRIPAPVAVAAAPETQSEREPVELIINLLLICGGWAATALVTRYDAPGSLRCDRTRTLRPQRATHRRRCRHIAPSAHVIGVTDEPAHVNKEDRTCTQPHPTPTAHITTAAG